jgi:hypothetical protein
MAKQSEAEVSRCPHCGRDIAKVCLLCGDTGSVEVCGEIKKCPRGCIQKKGAKK